MDKLGFYNDTININELWFESHINLLEKIAVELDASDQVEYLTEKFLGKKMKMKKMVDNTRPKKAKSSFIFFCSDVRPNLMKENPSLKLGGIMKELGKQWSNLEDRSKYETLHKQDKDRYENELEEYMNK